MDQLVSVLLAIDKALMTLYRTLGYEPGYGGLNQAYAPNHPTPSSMHRSLTNLTVALYICMPPFSITNFKKQSNF